MKTNIKKRVLICGDSISKGVTFDDTRKRYTNIKAAVANTIASIMHLEIDNLSKFGNTVNKAINQFKKAIDSKEYKYVIFELGGNDCDFNWKEVAQDPNGTHQPNTEYSEYKHILKKMIKTARKKDITPILTTLPPIDAHKYFNWISSFSEDAKPNILSWLGDVNRIYWWQERYNAGVLQVANETHCPVIDVRSALLETEDYRDLYCIDGIHPNERGHQIMTNAVITSLKNMDFNPYQ